MNPIPLQGNDCFRVGNLAVFNHLICFFQREFLQIQENLKTPPALVITDSQLIRSVAAVVPSEINLTTFSTLFARYKGDLKILYDGAKHLQNLPDNAEILIAEACSHHVQDDDIARVVEVIRGLAGTR